MSAKVMSLQKALVTLMTSIRFDFGMNGQDVLGKVMFSGKLMSANCTLKSFSFLVNGLYI
jgi:hypothetical protein